MKNSRLLNSTNALLKFKKIHIKNQRHDAINNNKTNNSKLKKRVEKVSFKRSLSFR